MNAFKKILIYLFDSPKKAEKKLTAHQIQQTVKERKTKTTRRKEADEAKVFNFIRTGGKKKGS